LAARSARQAADQAAVRDRHHHPSAQDRCQSRHLEEAPEPGWLGPCVAARLGALGAPPRKAWAHPRSMRVTVVPSTCRGARPRPSSQPMPSRLKTALPWTSACRGHA